jgi:hypothetical protein
MSDQRVSNQPPRGRTAALVGAGISLASGATGAILRFVGEDPPLQWNDALGALALGIAIGLPGFITLAAMSEDRTSLLVAGALIALPLALLSFVMLIPLLATSVLLLIAASRGRARVIGVRSLAAIGVAVVLGAGAFFVLFATDDPVCWAKLANGSTVELPAEPFVHGNTIEMGGRDLPGRTVESGCSSDSITPAEALASLLLSACTIVVPPRIGASGRPAASPAAVP